MTIPPDEIEGNARIRYGFYLRPSFEVSRAQAEMHDLLERQFGLRVGGQFMPHVTIMSFFRSEATLASIQAAIESVVEGRAPFTVYNNGPKPHGRSGVSLDVHHAEDGAPNAEMVAVHEATFAAILPLAHSACEFAFGPWSGEWFRAHLTLAMADIPDFLFDEVLEFTKAAEPIGPTSFTAEYFHLYAFESLDWGGKWWETMAWTVLDSWRLPG